MLRIVGKLAKVSFFAYSFPSDLEMLLDEAVLLVNTDLEFFFFPLSIIGEKVNFLILWA